MPCRRPWRIAALALLWIDADVARAGDPVPQTDLSLSLAVSPDLAIYESGTLVDLEYTVTNHGPDPSPGSRMTVGSFAYDGPNSQVTIVPNGQTAPCDYSALSFDAIPGFHGSFIVSLNVPAIGVHESLSCSVRLGVLETARGTYALDSDVHQSALAGQQSFDPDVGNNAVSEQFVLTPPGQPAPLTDLAVTLQLEPEQPEYPPGTEAKLHIEVRNDGPEDSRGSFLTLDDSLLTDPLIPIFLLPIPGSQGGGLPCLAGFDASVAPPGFMSNTLRFPGIPAGGTLTCELRLGIQENATGSFLLQGVMTPQPDFGDPTDDPDQTNDTAQIAIRITPAEPVSAPAIVPATSRTALLALIALLCLTLAWHRACGLD